MLWRKKNEDFEWRQYVRTTILVRRQRRRERLEEVKSAALFGVKQAGRRSAVAAASGANSAAAIAKRALTVLWRAVSRLGMWSAAALRTGARAAVRAMRQALSHSGTILAPVASRAGASVRRLWAPVVRGLANPAVQLPLALVAGSAALATGARLYGHDLDDQALISGSVAAATLILVIIPLVSSLGLPRVAREAFAGLGAMRFWPAGIAGRSPLTAILLIGALVGAGLWIAGRSAAIPVSVTSALLASTSTVEGRATALTGDRLRLSGTIVELTGIEAPEPDQRCARPSVQQWRCGAAAREELARIVRGRRVVCAISRGKVAGDATGICSVNGADIAAELVSGGHVFAESGLLARYGSEEASARSAKAGLWAGEADRPSDYRAKRWAEAKLASPEGCPIKGRITSGNRVYVLPWSRSYERIRVRSSRGERWFCSEADARAAGFRPTEPS